MKWEKNAARRIRIKLKSKRWTRWRRKRKSRSPNFPPINLFNE
jgi:hypothetical protein